MAMLLRAVEEKAFFPLGSDRVVQSDFQLIAGTNHDQLNVTGTVEATGAVYQLFLVSGEVLGNFDTVVYDNGGAIGLSLAYHLGKLGMSDVLLKLDAPHA